MAKHVLEQIHAFISELGSPAAPVEIAEKFLHLKNPTPHLAKQLVASLLGKDHRFSEFRDGSWGLADASPVKTGWVLCKVFPARTHWHSIYKIGVARYEAAHISGIQWFSESLYTQETAARVADACQAEAIIFDGVGNQLSVFKRYIQSFVSGAALGASFTLTQMTAALKNIPAKRDEEELSRALGLPHAIDSNPEVQFDEFIEQFMAVFELLHENGLATVDEITQLLSPKPLDDLFENKSFDASFLEKMTVCPGVYIMRSKEGEVIYVGKAGNLQRRLKSYFSDTHEKDAKIARIRQLVDTIEIQQTGNELEAFLLEDELIKKFSPPINTQTSVHNRDHLEKQRFPQIVLLPGVTADDISVVLLHPSRAADVHVIKKRRITKKIERAITAAFFAGGHQKSDSSKEEIITSWLSQNADHVSRIDMRLVSSLEEALRLLRKHVDNFKIEEPTIQV